MKKIFTFLFITLIFFGCKKDGIEKINTQNPKSLTKAEAKAFLGSLPQIKTESGDNTGFNPATLLEKIDWENASQIDSGKVLIGKFEGQPTENGVKLGFRKALFFKDSLGKLDLVIMEFIPDIFHLWKYKGINGSKYDGKILFYNSGYKMLHGYNYVNGVITGEIFPSKPIMEKSTESVKTNDVSITTCRSSTYVFLNGNGTYEAGILLSCHTTYLLDYGSSNRGDNVLIDELIDGGGEIDRPLITPVPIPEPIFPGQNDPKVDGKKMMDCFNNISSVNADFKVTLYVKEPLPGTNFNIGSNWVGHVAIGMTKTASSGNSITQVIGFYPSGSGLGSPGEIHNNSSMDYNVSIDYNISLRNFNAMIDFMSGQPPYYDLVKFNCASYAYSALTIFGGINIPSPFNPINSTNLSPLQASPANMGENMRQTPGANSSLTNMNAPLSHGECN